MSILVIAEQAAGQIKSSTLHCVTAAQKLGSDVTLLVAGSSISATTQEAAKISGVTKVVAIDSPSLSHQLPEVLAPALVALAPSYSHILAPATAFGKNLLPRVAGLLDVQPLSDVIEILSPTQFKRPVYAGNVIATFESKDKIKLLTIRTTAFDAAPMGGSAATESGDVSSLGNGISAEFVSEELTKSERPELASAKIVVSGGRGVGSAENFALIEKLADKLGSAVGASRAAVDAGYAPNDYQVGQTGKVVAPELYIAVGISGAIQHLAGMKDSKVIVAINKDSEAPIFQVADYGLVADLFEAVPEMTEKV
ncbi:MAG TPA: FAD-binding protein [Alphaproteobacteria bacterium]|nr:FAD-binding protein [Alphaproteobacteria bacterium]